MKFRSASYWRLLLLVLGLGLSGCLPPSDSPLDEQKEPYFAAGMRRLSSFDYRGAVEAFEKAIVANPRSASAHFQLGLLYEQKVSEENSYAVAIYHYNKFLQLQPKSEYAEIVRQRIIACKHELAKPIALAPGAQSVLRDLERLRVENAQLKVQLEAWAAAATNRAASLPPTQPLIQPHPGYGQTSGPLPTITMPSRTNPPPNVPRPALRTHKVQSNETPTTIAKKYGITPKALMEANPGIDARRLKIGQVLNVPAG
jgi:LysM repeat protein